MPRLFWRFVALVAVLLMPAVMAGAPVAAQAVPAAEAGHCNDHEEPAEDPIKQQAHCMACSALPALESQTPVAAPIPRTPRVIASTRPISGIILEIATPPPKLS